MASHWPLLLGKERCTPRMSLADVVAPRSTHARRRHTLATRASTRRQDYTRLRQHTCRTCVCVCVHPVTCAHARTHHSRGACAAPSGRASRHDWQQRDASTSSASWWPRTNAPLVLSAGAALVSHVRAYTCKYTYVYIQRTTRAYVHIIWTTSASLLPAHVVVLRVHVRPVLNEHRRDVAVDVKARHYQRGVVLQEESGHT